MQDIRFAIRQLLKNPGFAFVSVFTLALAIGAITAIFSVLNAVILRPLPFPEPDQLVRLYENHREQNQDFVGLSAPAFNDWRRQNTAFEDLAAFQGTGFDMTTDSETRPTSGARVSASFFPLLRIEPALGRHFNTEEDTESGKQVALISHRLWQEQFGGAESVIGKSIRLDGKPTTVVGVLPANFVFQGLTAEVWVPIGFERFETENRGGHNYQAIGRLKPGVTIEKASAEIQSIAARISEEYDVARGWGATLVSLHDSFVGTSRRPLWILFGAVGMILLIACSNVANLLLARAAIRAQEFALRLSLGAARGRIARQILCETGVLAAISAVAGWFTAFWILTAISRFGLDAFPRMGEIQLDWRIAIFTVGASLITAVISGAAPIFALRRTSLSDVLKERDHRSSSRHGSALRRGLVIAQIALSLTLMVGASLLLRSFNKLQELDLGFRPKKLLTAALAMPDFRFPGRDAERREFLTRIVERVSTLPGVVSAASVMGMPYSFVAARTELVVEGRPDPKPNEPRAAGYSQISTNYFGTIGATLLRGRNFNAADTADAPLVMIVNERFARTFFPGEDPIGKRLRIMDSLRERPTEIVGIVRDIRQRDLVSAPAEEMYFPSRQRCWAIAHLVIRTHAAPMSMEQMLRTAVAEVDPQQTLFAVSTMDSLLDSALQQRRVQTALIGVFAVVALVLSVVGIYGVMAYVVARRTHEIGIRISLGAAARQINTLILGEGMRITAIGIACGLLGAWAMTSAIRSLLFEVAPNDMPTFTLVPLVMAGAALLACWLPARRAARVDPIIALRHE